MTLNLQPPHLSNELVELTPLQESDFESLYRVASDPLIWEQHPNPDRYKRDVFTNFFRGALESGGAFLIRDASSKSVIGCSRYYDYEPDNKVIKIGYTFFSRSCWGKQYNRAVKTLMLEYIFSYVDAVIFHVGAGNLRSRKAMEKLGAERVGQEEVAYYGEEPRLNVVYRITKEMWLNR